MASMRGCVGNAFLFILPFGLAGEKKKGTSIFRLATSSLPVYFQGCPLNENDGNQANANGDRQVSERRVCPRLMLRFKISDILASVFFPFMK